MGQRSTLRQPRPDEEPSGCKSGCGIITRVCCAVVAGQHTGSGRVAAATGSGENKQHRGACGVWVPSAQHSERNRIPFQLGRKPRPGANARTSMPTSTRRDRQRETKAPTHTLAYEGKVRSNSNQETTNASHNKYT